MKLTVFGKTLFDTTPTQIVVNANQSDIAESYANHQSFSLADWINSGNNNLAAPVIKEVYQANGVVYFGTNNLEPNEISRLYYTSSLNKGIINFKRSMICGGGYTFLNQPITTDDKLNLYKFEKMFRLPKTFKEISLDYIIHGTVYIELLFDKNHKLVKANRIDPIKMRNGKKNDKGEIESYFYANDWTCRSPIVQIPAYKAGKTDLRQMYVYQDSSPGMDIYCLPPYISAANAIHVMGDIPYMYKSYLANSINPAFYLNFPRRLNKAANDELRKTLESGRGVKKNGITLVFQSDNKDSMPEIGTITTSNNDKLFQSVKEQMNEIICQGHSINPGIFGIKVNNSLGNGDELKTSYLMFKGTIIAELKNDIEAIINDIMFIANLPQTFVINDFDPIQYELTTLEKDSKEDFTSEEKSANPAIVTNEAVRSLTAKQNQQLLRIIRQYGKGQITYEAAAVLLRTSLGFSEDDIAELLGETE